MPDDIINLDLDEELTPENTVIVSDSNPEFDFNPVEAPIQRKLVICHSSNLPDNIDRLKDHVYLVYDKLQLYIYQTLYTDPFCIIESLEHNKEILTNKMLYITMDGSMYSISNHIVYHMGDLKDHTQTSILESCGTSYFMNAESRYFDKQKKLLMLPFKHGVYQLNLSLVEDLIVDEETVIRFNPETNQFYIAGKEYQFDTRLNNLRGYSGMFSPTVETYIDGHTFRSNVRLSAKKDNDIQTLPGGLYVSTHDLASQEKYLDMIAHFVVIKKHLSENIIKLANAVREAEQSSSQDSLERVAQEVLENYKYDIEQMFARYNTIDDRLTTVEERLDVGFTEELNAAKDEIKAYVDSTNTTWTELQETTGNGSDDSELNAMVLDELRESFKTLRESEGIKLQGFSSSENELQNTVLNEIDNIVNSLNAGVDKV